MSGKKTKEIILREAFKLFLAKTYEQRKIIKPV